MTTQLKTLGPAAQTVLRAIAAGRRDVRSLHTTTGLRVSEVRAALNALLFAGAVVSTSVGLKAAAR